jgi:hypothetical protein
MADRHNPHNGRDVDGRFRVRQADVDDVLEDPEGVDLIRDDIRLGGAVADTGAQAGINAQHIGDLIADNRDDVGRATGSAGEKSSRRGRRGRNR